MKTCMVLVGALAASCAGQGDAFFDIVFDACEPLLLRPAADASDRQLQGIADAIDMWNHQAGTQLTLEAAEGTAELPIAFEAAALVIFGVYEDETGSVLINSNLTDSHELAVTIAHEVGHAFGLVHVSGHSSVMNPGNLVIEPGDSDSEALVALWGTCATEPPPGSE